MLDVQAGESSPEGFVAFVTQSANLVPDISEQMLMDIKQQVLTDYETDKASMFEWRDSAERGLELATLEKNVNRSYPFEGSANIKYPLVTSAALQFNARAYAAVVPPGAPVKVKVWGADEGGEKAARADRVAEYQSYQCHSIIKEWEEQTDDLLVQLPVTGTVVRKWWWDSVERRPACRVIQPGKFVVNDAVKTLAVAPRMTEELSLFPIEVQQRTRAGLFIEFEWDDAGNDDQAPQEFIEQHTLLDLDGDGMGEPYVVTVHVGRQEVVRVVADFEPDDVHWITEKRLVETPVAGRDAYGIAVTSTQIEQADVRTGIAAIRRRSHFVPFKFMPSLKGGFYGTGLGIVLGDISDTINSIFNIILDAAHYSSLGGGFIGSAMRIKGGAQRFKPGEWRKIETTGATVRESMVPLTFPGPDQTMFSMLGMLIDAGREIASVKDVMTGDAPRAQQTATATLALIEQGQMVFSAVYKRIFRSLEQEFQIIAKMNAKYLEPGQYSKFHDMRAANGQTAMLDPAQEFALDDMDIQPVADPRSVTKMQQAAKAQIIMDMAQRGLVDPVEATTRMAEAMSIEDIESLLPKPNPLQEQMLQIEMETSQLQRVIQAAQVDKIVSETEENKAQAAAAMSRVDVAAAKAGHDAAMDKLREMGKALADARTERLGRGRPGHMASQPGHANGAGGNGIAPADGAAPVGIPDVGTGGS